MAVIDKLKRWGDRNKSFLVGPVTLVGPITDARRKGFASATRIDGAVDVYEITDGLGATEGAYTITIRPYSERGLTAKHRAVGRVALVRQVNGAVNPSAPSTVIGIRSPRDSASTVTLGPAFILNQDRVFVVIERQDTSTLRYILEVDRIPTLWGLAGSNPSLDLRFAENKSLVDATTGAQLVTFTRASSGTYVDSTGTIRTATTNLQRHSEDFTQGLTPSNATLTANQGTAPNGTLTADQLLETTANGLHNQEIVDHVFISGTTYTFSCYAKSIGGRNFGPGFPTLFSSARFGFFDLSGSGSVVSTNAGVTASIQAVGDGWYRCVITSTCVTGGGARVGVFIASGTSIAYTGDSSKGLLLWGAQLEQSSTVGEYVPTTSAINSAPRFDHNPTTGESLGLLVEESRVNSIRNNTMVGAVAGTPGTLPTNWSIGSLGTLTRTIVGTGKEDGIDYVDIRLNGTSSTPEVVLGFEGTNIVAAASGQAWTSSLFAKVVAGSLTNVTSGEQFIIGHNSSNTLVEAFGTTFSYSTTGALAQNRIAVTRTLSNANTAFVHTRLDLNINSGAAIDITLRIGMPQLEQGAFATSVIPTTGSAATRAPDVASISGSNFSSWYRQDEGALFLDAASAQSVAAANVGAVINDGTLNNRIELDARAGSLGGAGRATVTSGGEISFDTGNSVSPAFAVNTFYKQGVSYKLDSFAYSLNGGVAQTDASGGVPTAPDRMEIGARFVSGLPLNGTIRRLTYFPQRLGNEVLQRITQ